MTENFLVKRQSVAPVSSYREYRDALRVDFWFSCAYCSITEVEAWGIRFTIDHYEPKSARPDLALSYENLLWACDHCNELKGDLCPPPSARVAGDRFVRPDQDIEHEHYSIIGVRQEGITSPGRFSELHLDLNRQTLRRLREIRARLDASAEHVLRGLNGLAGLSLDRLKPAHRTQYLLVVGRLREQHEAIDSHAEKLEGQALKEMGRSELLDKDPEAETRSEARREDLVRKKAIHGAFRNRSKARKTTASSVKRPKAERP